MLNQVIKMLSLYILIKSYSCSFFSQQINKRDFFFFFFMFFGHWLVLRIQLNYFCSSSSSTGHLHFIEQSLAANQLEKQWWWSVYRIMERSYLWGISCCFHVWAHYCKHDLWSFLPFSLLVLFNRFLLLFFNSQLSGLGLSGTMGYLLSDLMSLRTL